MITIRRTHNRDVVKNIYSSEGVAEAIGFRDEHFTLDPHIAYLLISRHGFPVGVAEVRPWTEETAEVHYSIMKSECGTGFPQKAWAELINTIKETSEIKNLVTYIPKSNTKSMIAAAGVGFKSIKELTQDRGNVHILHLSI